MQSASPSRLSRTSDGSASSVPGTVTADLDSSLQHGSSSSIRRRQVGTFACCNDRLMKADFCVLNLASCVLVFG